MADLDLRFAAQLTGQSWQAHFGHSYGHHSIWQMWEPGLHGIFEPQTAWQQALYFPGAYQMGYMKALFTSLPWTMLRPAQSLLIVTATAQSHPHGCDCRRTSGRSLYPIRRKVLYQPFCLAYCRLLV